MTDIISIILIIALSAIGIAYPPYSLLIYGLAVNQGDGFGIARFLSSIGFELYIKMQSVILISSSLSSAYKIYTERNINTANRTVWHISILLIVLLLWIFISSVLKQGDMISIPNIITYAGVQTSLIALAYRHDKKAIQLFVVLLIIHQTISALLITFPDSIISLFSATNYNPGDIDLSGVTEEFTGEIARYGDSRRMYAQHINPNTYGLYSTVALATGLCLIVSKQIVYKLVGSYLAVLSVMGIFVTFSRGSLIGLLIGIAIIFVKKSNKIVKNVILILLVLSAIFLSVNIGSLLNLLEPQDILPRLLAMQLSVDVISSNLLLGAPLDFVWPDNIPPHQIMIYFAAVNGIIAGIIVTLLYIVSIKYILSARSSNYHQIMFGCICLITGLVNNFAAPVLFWLSLATVFTSIPEIKDRV